MRSIKTVPDPADLLTIQPEPSICLLTLIWSRYSACASTNHGRLATADSISWQSEHCVVLKRK